MEIKIASFYQIRFLKPYQIPVSTAAVDPNWFHDNKGRNYVYTDKNGVLNGIRYEDFSHIKINNAKCFGTRGYGEICDGNPETCDFLNKYEEKLLSLDFNIVMKKLQRVCDEVKSKLGFTEEPEIIFIVYEAENNPHSERGRITKMFNHYGVKCTNFKHNEN